MKWEIVTIIFIILILIVVGGCGSKPKTTPVELNWQFCDLVPNEPLACLNEGDVKKLRQALIECRSQK